MIFTLGNQVAESLPCSWAVRPFEELVFFQEGPGIRNWQYVDLGIPFVNIRCLVNGRLDRAAMNHVSEDEALGKYKHFLLDAGDYVVSSSGTLGRIATVDAADLPCMLNTSVIRMRPRGSDVDRRFLKYFLHSDYYKDQIHSFATGSAQLNYGPMHLRQMFIVVPPLPEQHAIASILGSLDDKIDLNRRMNETLEAMARALFKDWFIDFGPTRAKMEGREPYLAPDLWALFPDRLDDEEKPEEWEVVSASVLVAFNPSEKLAKGTNAPFLEMAALPTSGSTTEEPVLRPFTSGSKFRRGDTLLARITPSLENGKTAFVHDLDDGVVGWGSTEFVVMRAKPFLPSQYAYLLARHDVFRDIAIQSMTGTSGRQRAQVESLTAFPVIRPPAEIAAAFGGVVQDLFSRIGANARESRTLAQTRDLLLPKLMSGEIRVREAERMVEEVV